MIWGWSLLSSMVVAASIVTLCGDASAQNQTMTPAPRSSDLEALLWPAGARPPADHHGAMVTPTALRGRLAVVSFVAPECSIVCVVRTRDLDRVARALPGRLRRRVAFLAVSLSDAQVGNGSLRTFAEGVVAADTPLRFVAADPTWSAAVAAMVRYPSRNLPEPPPQILLFDRQGGIAMTYGGEQVDRLRLAQDITVLDTFAQGLDAPPD
ncbi:MAG: hypothetical protein K2X71_12220 [Methylobacterium sp.]|uniref:SCO family protein n=1 Tax=Methylobacterium sp. TaxID=409 RepID=UPI002590D982|nr:hypothetical protein [Methylobacterium sp.]MBY0296788.1 hypothetical protein [Methylobacterium sp.]